MEIVTFKNDNEGGTFFSGETITLQFGVNNFLTASPLLSTAHTCQRYFFSELPPGYQSGGDFSSRRQICVLLSGELEVMSTGGETKYFVAGDVLRLEDTNFQILGRTLRVTSKDPARILNVQIE